MQKLHLPSILVLLCTTPFAFPQEPASRPAVPTPVAESAQPEREAFDLTKAKDSVDEAVGAAEIAAHIAYLASDELEGRFTGSAGGKLAAMYLAEALAKLEPFGLQPGGDNGTYLQDINLKSVQYDVLPTLRTESGEASREIEYGSEFELVAGLAGSAALRVVIATEVDDPLLDTPDKLTALYFAMGTIDRRKIFEERGPEWQAEWGALLLEGSRRVRRAVTSTSRIRNVAINQDGIDLPITFKVHGAVREALAAGSITGINFTVTGKQSRAYNVVALLPGKASRDADAAFSREIGGAIVISAHYDHLRKGILREGDPAGTDLIYNGADDDASGVAAVIEIAEAIAIGGDNERDLVILLATGEEIGLIGTSYYLDHPLVPLDRTLCNLNFEMIGRPDPAGGGFGKLWLTGYDYSSLGPALAGHDLELVRDPHPSEHYYERSDNYAFVLKGIVGQTFSSYNGHDDYHHTSDEVEGIDFWHMETAVRACTEAVSFALDLGFSIDWANGYTPPRR